LADIVAQAADDGGEAVGQRGNSRCMCHTCISAWGVGGEKEEREGKAAFLKKSSKKLLVVGVRVVARARAWSRRVFGAFLQKRTAFCSLDKGPP
ncbi:hypothetical protein, partial [Acidiphilium sp.]|uniref:hypothetical protein n=1 Tax=Acidiphilium sp. TaxID=527 RepID=UPI003D05C42F